MGRQSQVRDHHHDEMTAACHVQIGLLPMCTPHHTTPPIISMAAHLGQLHVRPVAIVPEHCPPLGTTELAGQVGMRQYLYQWHSCRRQARCQKPLSNRFCCRSCRFEWTQPNCPAVLPSPVQGNHTRGSADRLAAGTSGWSGPPHPLAPLGTRTRGGVQVQRYWLFFRHICPDDPNVVWGEATVGGGVGWGWGARWSRQ